MSKSYEKINYLTRPSKHIERKIIIEIIQRLRECEFKISEYGYVGLGSPFYADFIAFHKNLYLENMFCIEKESIQKRMEFNKPYGFIDLKIGEASDIIPDLKENCKYIVWLDFDDPLDVEIIDSVGDFARFLSPQSILIVSANSESRLPDNEDDYGLSDMERRKKLIEYYNRSFGKYLAQPSITEVDVKKNMAPIFSKVLFSKINEIMSARLHPDISFSPLFNYSYADNASMVTIGGMLVEKGDLEKLKTSNIYKEKYVSNGSKIIEINAPPLTLREKHWIDNQIGNKIKIKVKDMPFELKPSLKDCYEEFYRYYPTFTEVLI